VALQRWPTLGEFLDRAIRSYGCTDRRTEVTVQGPKGEVRFRYLERNYEGRQLIAPLPDLADSDRLTHAVLEQLCRRLEIPPHIFY
jgi:hypothetical protein